MRISTTALVKSALLLVAVLALVPQYAFAQLPVETRELKLQGANSGSVLLKATSAGDVYTLQYPNVQGTVGAFLFLSATDGTLKWSTTGGGDGYTPIWDNTNKEIKWVDPAGATSVNWALAGNTLAANGKLGSKNGFDVNFVTNDNVRMSITSAGVVGINDGANGGTVTNIGRSGNTTNVDGTFDVDGVTNINVDETTATNINTGISSGKVTIGGTGNTVEINASTWDINAATATIDASTSLGITGTTNINTTGSAVTSIGHSGGTNINTTGNGAVAIGNTNGGSSFTGAIKMVSDAGADGEVLVSKGPGATPEWQNLTESIGIRKAGNVTVSTAAVATDVISVTDLASSDAILITLQGSGSTVVPTVTDRSNTASGSFKVTFSAAYSGVVNYLVIRTR
ncbi:MAG: hypothetical protein FGM32_11035 [Candidatus Kapabacteria bacterium]|nr:hypothetical protein [Candidatus Kapabacteria bacterium]